MLTSGKTPFAVGGETAIRRVGRVAECTSPLTRQAVRLRRFESSTLRNFIQNMEQTTIESRVASAILERNVGNIEIEGVTYEIAPPSIATLIVVSEFIASLPIVEKVEKTEIVNSVLHHARFFRPLGDIAATLILGAKSLTEERVVVQEKRYLFGHIKRKSKKKIKIDKRAELAKAILENVRPTVLFNVVVQRLQDMEISSFFAITTSLSEANILKPTKEVVKG